MNHKINRRSLRLIVIGLVAALAGFDASKLLMVKEIRHDDRPRNDIAATGLNDTMSIDKGSRGQCEPGNNRLQPAVWNVINIPGDYPTVRS